jgi:cytoskeletal protein CcmA (bactofilin family)
MKDNETNLNAGINHLLYRTEYSSANTDSICSGRGDLWFRGNLHIDGIFSGKLNVCGCLTVGKNAHITGEVEINDLILFGELVGNVRVNNLAVFHSTSTFSGTMSASEAEFRSGCKISGERSIGRITEIEEIKCNKNNIFKIDDPAIIPDEMTHPGIRF